MCYFQRTHYGALRWEFGIIFSNIFGNYVIPSSSGIYIDFIFHPLLPANTTKQRGA